MSDRSWFFAFEGKQQGPYPEDHLREFIAKKMVKADTLVWTEGMSGWQKAGDIPGLLSGGSVSLAVPQPAVPATSAVAVEGGVLSIDYGIWEFIWRTLVLSLGFSFIIPMPWAVTMYCRWLVSSARVPGRPNLSFTGRPVELMWFYGVVILFIGAAWSQSQLLSFASNIVILVLYWLFINWFVSNISSNGQRLGLSFSGSFWAYFGWSLLAVLSILTIIGWAWVYTAQLRWICRNIQGTRRAVVFNGSGLEFLWRTLVAVLASLLIIPMPWMYRWMARWLVSQIALVDRNTLATA
jgi:hypothetical protein